MPDPDVTVPGMADTYFTRLSNALISAADWAAAQAWLVGYRIGRDGETVPGRLLGNVNVTNGYAAGVHDR